MSSSLFISSDLGTVSSGNTVSNQELEALKTIDNNVIEIRNKDINPTIYNLLNHPFIQDYLTMVKVSQLDISNIKLAHFYSGPYSNTMRYLKAKNPNIIITNTIDAHDRQESIQEFETLGYQYPFQHIKDINLYKIYTGFLKEADILITPSSISKKCLINDGADKSNIDIIPHGVDIPPAEEIKPITDPNDEFNVGYLGAYGADKGIKYLIQSWSELNYPNSKLLLAGANATKDLEPFIRKYSTNGRFNILGYVNDIKDFYNNISVYVQPSITEGWGIEVAEAMSYGRPVIVSDGAGSSDMVTNNKDGFIVKRRDPKSISDKIDYLKNHPKELNEMGEKARERSLQYNWTSIRKMYTDLWQNIII